jgi:biotin carboxylase
VAASPKRILIVFPTVWDRRQLDACRAAWSGRFEPILIEPTAEDFRYDLDVLGFIDEAVERWRGRIDGVTSASDYPGATVAAAIATALGLPGSPPEAILGCSHKYLSRLSQRKAVPEATPGFALVDSGAPEEAAAELTYPCFVKPVKGAYSVHSGRVDSADELVAFLSTESVREFTEYHMKVFDRLLGRYVGSPVGGRFFLAEDLLSGRLVTLEGFVHEGRVEVLGVTDSVTHPGTGSFVRFDYPSELPADVQERMGEIAARAVLAAGLDSVLFNLELLWDPGSGRISIVEINPRMCGQFSDLYAKVDGTAGYEIALVLAAGERPTLRRRTGPHALAASVPLRVFEPVRVARAPTAADLAAAEALYPGTRVWTECTEGDELADFDRWEDGKSYRYGVVNLGAPDRARLLERFERVRERLGYRIEPLRSEG